MILNLCAYASVGMFARLYALVCTGAGLGAYLCVFSCQCCLA